MQRDQSLDSEHQQTSDLEPYREPEIGEESPEAGDLAEISENQKSYFRLVAGLARGALDPNGPNADQLNLQADGLREKERVALTLLREAKTAKESEIGAGRLSATERWARYQQALRLLSQVFGWGRSTKFPAGQQMLQVLRPFLRTLREELQQAIVDEERKMRFEKEKKKLTDGEPEDEEAKKKKPPVEGSTL